MNRAIEPLLMQSMTREPILRDTRKGKRVEAFDRTLLHLTCAKPETRGGNTGTTTGASAADIAQNIVTESFGIEIADVEANTSTTFYVQQVLRHHIEDGRVVFVWNTYIEPLAFTASITESYVLIKPDTESDNCTCMSSHEVITPHFWIHG